MAALSASSATDPLAYFLVRDGLGRPVADSIGPLTTDVPLGLYEIRATARGRAAVEIVVVEDDDDVNVTLPLGRYTSAAPTLGSDTFDGDHAALLDETLSLGGGLVVMVRHVDGSGGPADVPVALEGPGAHQRSEWLERDGARGAAVSALPGLCIVRVGSDGGSAQAVPVWDGYQTVVVVPMARGRPVPDRIAIHCVPTGTRWADGQGAAEVTEQVAGAVRDGVTPVDIASTVAGQTPLHHLLRGDYDALRQFDPVGIVTPADLAALRIRSATGVIDETPDHVDDPPVLASSADTLLHHEARHPWSLGERVSATFAARLASGVVYRWRSDGAEKLPNADAGRWHEDVSRFARRVPRPAQLHRMAVGSAAASGAGRRVLSHVADRSYARRVPPEDVVHAPVGDLVLTTGLPAAALQAGLGEAVAGIRWWRRRRRLSALAATVAVVAVVGAVALWLLPGSDGGWPVDDAAAVDEDGTIFIDPLANDESGRPLRLISAGQAANGTVAVEGEGLRYTPNPDFSGADAFPYVVDDGTEQAEGTVEVTVRPVNDAPVAADDQAAAAAGATIDIDVLANDLDVDDDRLTVTAVDDPGGRASAQENGVRFAAPAEVPGEGFVYELGYTVEDGNGGSAGARVFVTLEPGGGAILRPAADTADTAAETPVDIDVTANDEGVTGSTQVVLDGPPARGEVQVSGTEVRYTPTPEFVGTDTFTYRLVDGGAASEPAPVTIRVLPRITIDDVRVVEPPKGEDVPVPFIVRLSAAGPDQVTVSWETVEGTATAGADFAPARGVVTFEPGQTAADLTVLLLGDDGFDDAEETFEVRLGDATNAFVDPEFGVATAVIENRAGGVD